MAGVDNPAYQANGAEKTTDITDLKVEIEDSKSVQPKKKDNSLLFTCGVLVLLILVAAVVILGIGIYTHGFGTWGNQDVSDRGVMPLPTPAPPKCNTISCARAAARLADSMDESVDPCDDFYQFACGGYEKKRILTEGVSSLQNFQELDNQMKIKMKNVLEGKSVIDNQDVIKQVKNLYKSCMNESEIERLGVQPLKDVITAKGGWSFLGEWNDTNFDLEKYMATITSSSFVWIGVNQNIMNSSQNVLTIAQLGMSIANPVLYNDSKVISVFNKTLLEIGASLGGNMTIMIPEVEKFIEFEKELAAIQVPSANRRDENNTLLMTIGEISQHFKSLNLVKYVNLAYAGSGVKLNNESLVNVWDVPYFKKLDSVLTNTSNETIAGSIMWRYIRSSLQYLDKESSERWNQVNELITGAKAKDPRYKICSSTTNWMFNFPLARLYVAEHFKEGISDIEDMSKRILNVFEERLNDQDWLDEESRQKAKEKVNAMALMLGFPQYMLNDTILAADYNITGLKTHTYFTNMMRLLDYHRIQGVKKLLEPVDKMKWQILPLVVNAFYSPQQNAIVFPLGILQPPFYDITGPKMMNYGLIGYIIGHEVTHGFDTSGALFDKNGNRIRWMTLESLERFKNRTKCVENDYSQMVIKQLGTKVDGKLTLTENIADLGGIKQAFQAYRNWVKENGEEGSLPGLSYTNEQLFFLSSGQAYCHLITDQLLSYYSMRDSHTPMRERVLGALKNSEDFAEVFKCPIGSNMNPSKKCSVW